MGRVMVQSSARGTNGRSDETPLRDAQVVAERIDGRAVAQALRNEVAREAESFRATTGIQPRLEVVLVGEDPASQVYVRNKTRACREVGIASGQTNLPATTEQAELLHLIDRLNADLTVHGILVQLPLPRQIREREIIERVSPRKDVDGFHPENAGLLAIGTPRFVPCTPLGVQHLLLASDIPIAGRHAVVIGRSNIVGKPLALLLLAKGQGGDATVTVCHSASRDVPAIARQADILIAAMGRPEAVRGYWIKPGAVVIDVGIHRRADGSLCGDVFFPEAEQVASRITPVPGGVGPMTIAMLLRNTLAAAQASVA